MNMNPNGFQCSICKSIIGPDNGNEEDEEDEMLINNISVIDDLDKTSGNHSGPLNEVLK
jgi:hypothetical protein